MVTPNHTSVYRSMTAEADDSRPGVDASGASYPDERGDGDKESADGDAPEVTVLLFAAARVSAGTGRDVVRAHRVGDVMEIARTRYGANFAAVLDHSKVWVNGEPVPPTHSLSPGDEVAVLPPVSGGGGWPEDDFVSPTGGLAAARLGAGRLGAARLGAARLGAARLGAARLGAEGRRPPQPPRSEAPCR